MTLRRLHVIIVECGEININVIIYTEKVCDTFVNFSTFDNDDMKSSKRHAVFLWLSFLLKQLSLLLKFPFMAQTCPHRFHVRIVAVSLHFMLSPFTHRISSVTNAYFSQGFKESWCGATGCSESAKTTSCKVSNCVKKV